MSSIIIMEKEELRLLVEEAVQNVMDKNTPKEDPAKSSDLMTVDEVCRFLTMKKSTLYQKTHKSEIPFSKKGKPLYFSRKEIIDWVASGRNLTKEERERALESIAQDNKNRRNINNENHQS